MSRTIPGFALVALLGAVAGCPTTQEVRAIVGESNAALEASAVLAETDLSELRSHDSARHEAAVEKAQAAVRRIDAFLAAHPGMKSTGNALTMRKALLLMVAGKPQMAKAAFAGYDASVRGNTRDLGLYQSFEILTWWWGVRLKLADDIPWDTKKPALRKLDELIAGLSRGEGITYYLLTMRANIQLKRASAQDDVGSALRQGLKNYSAGFDAQARAQVHAFAKRPAELKDVPFDRLRWLAQAKVTYDDYLKVWNGAGLGQPAWDPDCKWLEELRG